ncbi:hypothetical protein Smp_154130 [Schistosoma mansoni]|uniref:hypothetical protein n=1 Tax=Schistosoma mansoni TaxID=6183 RepID=UPI00022DBFC0|nr:hypothetical protein Smp_154130 [Schistosoma mansoni]|eukprot:XP_018653185.1 hypothetical protein Smp_154130 [Schistosoma mansoni]
MTVIQVMVLTIVSTKSVIVLRNTLVTYTLEMIIWRIHQYTNVPSIKAAKNFYETCTNASLMDGPLIETKVVEMIEAIFNGWLMSANHLHNLKSTNNFLESEKFNLTAIILPLLFRTDATPFFDFGIRFNYQPVDSPVIHIRPGSLDAFNKAKLNMVR